MGDDSWLPHKFGEYQVGVYWEWGLSIDLQRWGIYPATTFSCDGFVSVTASDGWRCSHPASLQLLGCSTRAGCWGGAGAGCCTATTQLIREQAPRRITASWSCVGMNELLDAVLCCFSPCVVIYCCANRMKSDPSDPGVPCCWTCAGGSVPRGYLLRARVGTPGSSDKLLTLWVHSSAPGSQDFSCHFHIYICTSGSHICWGVSKHNRRQ